MTRRSRKAISSPLGSELLAPLKAAADPLRLEVLRVLSVDSFAVMELARLFDMPQPGMSHHLKILAEAGLLVTRKEGNSIFYRRALVMADHPLADLQQELYRAVDRLELPPEVSARIAEIHDERARHSMEFFQRNADRFQRNQELIARFGQYDRSVEELIRSEGLDPGGCAIEVGPGEGELLVLLSQLFAQVIALDNSPEMLERARANLARRRCGNVRFIEGEIANAVNEDLRADLLVLNMVLHHVASPPRFFQEGGRLLKPQGALVIIDLCPHDQEWVRESCGDLWLGFEPDDIELWAAHAGLARAQSSYLALRNGFQIQMQLFHEEASGRARDFSPAAAAGAA